MRGGSKAFEKAQRFLSGAAPEVGTRMRRLKAEYPRAFQRWTREEENLLRQAYTAGKDFKMLSEMLQRHPKSIPHQLQELGLVPATQQFWKHAKAREVREPVEVDTQTTWTVDLDNDLIDAYAVEASIDPLASRFQIDAGTIRARLAILAVLRENEQEAAKE